MVNLKRRPRDPRARRALAGRAALPAGAYQHFSQATGGTGVSPNRWQSLPIPIVVDNGPTDISAEIGTAVATWNDVATAQAVGHADEGRRRHQPSRSTSRAPTSARPGATSPATASTR